MQDGSGIQLSHANTATYRRHEVMVKQVQPPPAATALSPFG